MSNKPAVATGHPLTTQAAEQVLLNGGNAFDATVAAFLMACVCEPVLASLGGGGFLMAKPIDKKPLLVDFFVQTPGQIRPMDSLDIRQVMVNFSNAEQHFHVGNGTVAVPGSIQGVFEIQRGLGRMSMIELASQVIDAAKNGVRITRHQANIFKLVEPIYCLNDSAKPLFFNETTKTILDQGDLFTNPDFADFMEVLAIEGPSLFYSGEVASLINKEWGSNGMSINRSDLSAYRSCWRSPLHTKYQDVDIFLNPPPSAGGLLINFGLELLRESAFKGIDFGTLQHYQLIANVIESTQQARIQALAASQDKSLLQDLLFSRENLSFYQQQVSALHKANRGTTHISVLDKQGNIASLTVSNGEGCGKILNGTGIMLNNMLGEDDLTPLGLNCWQTDQRLSSMMCPSIVVSMNSLLALGSGGSNRIRNALLQVLINRINFKQALTLAVEAPRIHFDDQFYIETCGLDESVVQGLRDRVTQLKEFSQTDFYFGGVNAVSFSEQGTEAAADSRRGGVAVVLE